MKKILMMLMVAVILTCGIKVDVDAGSCIPKDVREAVNDCVDENGRCIVIDQEEGQMYLFKRNCKSQKWELKKRFRCITNVKLCKSKHYVLHRSKDIDLLAWGDDCRRWSYGIHIDCYERPYNALIHSYTEVRCGCKWITKKSCKWNKNGISICEKHAKHLWKYYGDGTAVMGV